MLIEDEEAEGVLHAVFDSELGVADDWEADVFFSGCSVRGDDEHFCSKGFEIVCCFAERENVVDASFFQVWYEHEYNILTLDFV